MKKLFLFALLFSSWMGAAQQTLLPLPEVTMPSSCSTDCPSPAPVGDPYIWSGDCSIGIERYLARTVAMPDLASYNFNNIPGQTACDPDNQYSSASYFHNYCPEKYCELIAALPELDAQLIQAAYFAGGTHEQEFYPGTQWYKMGRQLVQDINHAYDCAGKRRPIIQGFIGEIFNADNLNVNFTNQWNHIPPAAIAKYFEYYPEDLTPENEAYYFSSEKRYFNRENMATYQKDFDGNENWIPNISKLELRMWFLYQAMTMIDFGYKSIHMGIYNIYADHAWDPNYEHLYKLTNVMRQYASENGSFVLLSGEVPMANIDNGKSAKLAGTDHLIFDFDTRALRPREITCTPEEIIDGDCINISGDGGVMHNGTLEAACTDPIPPNILNAFYNSPCANEPFPAIVDPCTVRHLGGASGGIAPALDGSGNADCYMEQVPFISSLDGFNAPEDPEASGGPSSKVWGLDDHSWFAQLGDECREWWFDYFYCQIRDLLGGHGYLSIPGINMISKTGPSGKRFISDDPGFMDAVKATLLPDEEFSIQIHEECVYNFAPCEASCGGITADPGMRFRIGINVITIEIVHEDCASVYTIHVKDPAGNWLPIQTGNLYRIYPEMDGDYEVIAKQDNLGLPSGTFGSAEVKMIVPIMKDCCLGQIPYDYCFTTDYSAGDCHFTYYPNPATDYVNISALSSGTAPDGTTYAPVVTEVNVYDRYMQLAKSANPGGSEAYNLNLLDLQNNQFYILETKDQYNYPCRKGIVVNR